MECKNEMDLEITQVIVNVVSIRNSSDVFRFFFFSNCSSFSAFKEDFECTT